MTPAALAQKTETLKKSMLLKPISKPQGQQPSKGTLSYHHRYKSLNDPETMNLKQ